jgi:hypothetical protein
MRERSWRGVALPRWGVGDFVGRLLLVAVHFLEQSDQDRETLTVPVWL